MIPTDLRSPAQARTLKTRLTDWRGGADLSVGLGNLLWPGDGFTTPAVMFHLTEGGYFLATDGDLVTYSGWVARWVFDGDRFGLLLAHEDPSVVWVEHAPFAEEVKEMRDALTAEDIATVATESQTMILDAKDDPPPESYWVRQNSRVREYQVSLQMHKEINDLFVPNCWLVSGGGQLDNLTMFWAGETEQLQAGFKDRYNWQSAGWLKWAVEQDENSKPFARTKLYPVGARSPAEAVEIMGSTIFRDQGLTVG